MLSFQDLGTTLSQGIHHLSRLYPIPKPSSSNSRFSTREGPTQEDRPSGIYHFAYWLPQRHSTGTWCENGVCKHNAQWEDLRCSCCFIGGSFESEIELRLGRNSTKAADWRKLLEIHCSCHSNISSLLSSDRSRGSQGLQDCF